MALSTRRKFLLAIGGIGGLGAFATLPLAFPRASKPTGSLQSFQQSGTALGTKVTLLVLHQNEVTARTALQAAFAELRTVENIMSIYQPDSQLSLLNRAGSLANPHPYLLEVLRHSQTLAQQSHGAFDVTIQPLWDLHAAAYAQGQRPSTSQVTQTLTRIGFHNLRISPDRIQFRAPGMSIVLNGIAQGFAADRVRATLRAYGITQALINTGEIAPLGQNLDAHPWRVGIQHPRQPNAYIALAALDDRALATSGDYETSFTPDHRDNHIFDPATGYSPTQLASVSVVAPTTTLADGLSTALFVLGAARGQQLLQQLPHTDALFVLKDGTVLSTPHFPKVQA